MSFPLGEENWTFPAGGWGHAGWTWGLVLLHGGGSSGRGQVEGREALVTDGGPGGHA